MDSQCFCAGGKKAEDKAEDKADVDAAAFKKSKENAIERMLEKCPAKFVYAYRCEQLRASFVETEAELPRRVWRCRCYDCPFCPKPWPCRYDLVGFQSVRTHTREVILTVSTAPFVVLKVDGKRAMEIAFHPVRVTCSVSYTTTEIISNC